MIFVMIDIVCFPGDIYCVLLQRIKMAAAITDIDPIGDNVLLDEGVLDGRQMQHLSFVSDLATDYAVQLFLRDAE